MTKKRYRLLLLVLVTTDIIALVFANAFGCLVLTWEHDFTRLFQLYDNWFIVDSLFPFFYLLPQAVTLVFLLNKGHYTKRKPFWDEVHDIIKVVFIMAMFAFACMFALKARFSRIWLIPMWFSVPIFIITFRYIIKKVLIRIKYWQKPAVIVGTAQNAMLTYLSLRSEPLMGLDVIAFLNLNGNSGSQSETEVEGLDIPVKQLEAVPARLGNPVMIVAVDQQELFHHEKIIEYLTDQYKTMSLAVFMPGVPLHGIEINHFFGHEILLCRVSNNLARPIQKAIKRAFDIAVSFFLLVLLSPLLLYLISRVSLTGPVFFSHKRLGKNGKHFLCLKFRTMIPNAHKILKKLLASDTKAQRAWEQNFKFKNDPRITPFGAFLRKSSLDELPQLWNVLKGEMSLVGPRPIVKEETKYYGDDIKYYFQVRPGMTGLWQISGRNNVDYEKRVYFDTWYVKNWTLWYDIVILLKTFRVFFGKSTGW